VKKRILSIVALAFIPAASPAFAYQLKLASDNSKDCQADGSTCQVYCNNGHLAGSMNWNGSVWTDGVKWDKDKDVEARMICNADGTACV
jgi:hypothetical protein